MSVLTLRLAGPLQSWGSAARFTRRTTENAPTKSGVIGLLAGALGIERGDDGALERLAAVRFGVRVDQPGTRVRDFQTAHHPVTGSSMPLSERFYLADAVFVAAVEGEETLIDSLFAALRAPAFPPYLGRRSCPPSHPVELAVSHDADLEDVLGGTPWQAAAWYRRTRRGETLVPLTVLREPRGGEDGDGDALRDQPLSFSSAHRRHGLRTVCASVVDVPVSGTTAAPGHDPMAALGEELSR
ncbi:type I-E CRISPR-associated protein Cas5/CasD [Streptomyces xiamenensis]